MVGEDNPFGNFLGSALLKYRLGSTSGMIGILGPMRMDYARNLGLLNFIEDKIKE
jgi:transcriptional regulator of heat shock response